MNGSEEAQQSLTPPQHSPSSSSMSWSNGKRGGILLGVVAGLVVVAVVAVACLVVTVSTTDQPTETKTDEENIRQPMTLSNTEQQKRRAVREVARSRRAPAPSPAAPTSFPTQPLPPVDPSARPIPPPVNSDGSCTSQETESNIPAAHVKGHGVERGKWIQSTEESGSVVPGYQQRWICNDVYTNDPNHHHYQLQEQAFVDGGVWFNQTDKSLYVPKCGYYMVYSQVLFVMHDRSLSEGVTVFHNLKIKHNCLWESDTGPIQIQAKASVAPSPDGGVATTYTADVVHLCGGGSVWIEIPDGANGVPCCPRGDDSGTFLGLVLLADTPCSSWPPVITMTHEF